MALDPFELGFIARALTALFALGIVYISFEGWRRRKRPILLFISLAFLAYLLRSVIHLTEIVAPGMTSPMIIGMAAILDLVTLLLIFFAAVKK